MIVILATAAEVSERILGDEDSQTEFKGVRVIDGRVRGEEANPESIAGEMVAFANEVGGVILLGVEDDQALSGLSRTDANVVTDWIVNIARNNVVPAINPVIRTHRLDGASGPAWVVAVHIDRGLLHRTAGGRWYRRVGRDKRDVDPTEMERLVHQRGTRFAFDESPVPDASLEALDERLLERALAPARDLDWVQLLRNRKVIAGDGDHPTLAGLLVFGRHPEEHLPQALIRMAIYRGRNMDAAAIVHEDDLTGPLPRQINDAVALVDRYMQHSAVKSMGRTERPQFDLNAVMEAVVNAVVHRDYAVAGSRVRLFMFDDRLEVRSPGGLPNTLDLASMRYRQFTRNQLIVSLLAKTTTPGGGRYIEERGEGVERIIRLTAALADAEPSFILDGQELRVTLPGAPPIGQAS